MWLSFNSRGKCPRSGGKLSGGELSRGGVSEWKCAKLYVAIHVISQWRRDCSWLSTSPCVVLKLPGDSQRSSVLIAMRPFPGQSFSQQTFSGQYVCQAPFGRATLRISASATYAVAPCLSVCLSVRLPVHLVRVFRRNEQTCLQICHHSSFSTPNVMAIIRLELPNVSLKFHWQWVTLNPDFKVTILLNVR